MNRRSIVSLALSSGAVAIAVPAFAFSQASRASDTPPETLKVTIPNHVAVDIAATPDDVWRAIREEYGEAKKFRAFARVEPLDDPAAIFGGYRMTVEKDGVVVDDRIIHLIERDEKAMRLSLFANYLQFPGGLEVYATYRAQQMATRTRYAIDCFTRVGIPTPASGKREDVAAAVAEIAAESDKYLIDYLDSIRTRLEAAARPAPH